MKVYKVKMTASGLPQVTCSDKKKNTEIRESEPKKTRLKRMVKKKKSVLKNKKINKKLSLPV